jgi:hypothetical protein
VSGAGREKVAALRENDEKQKPERKAESRIQKSGVRRKENQKRFAALSF